MIIENTRHMINSSLQTPFFIPIAVERAITKVECADGIPPLQSILEKLKCPFAACTEPFTSIATARAVNGTASVYSYAYVWSISNIDYRTSRIVYSREPEGAITVAVSFLFFPMSAFPRGDSLLIFHSRIFAS